MKNKIIYIALAVITIIALIIIFNRSEYTDDLKTVELEKTNKIYNRTSDKSLDTIYRKGLEILNIKGETFLILEMGDNQKSIFGSDLKLDGTVSEKEGYYLIRTKLGSNKNSIEIASHELIHVKQMVNGYFTYDTNGVYYKGEYYRFPLTVDYYNVPWEVEAYDEAPKLLEKMRDSLLIKKN